MFWNISKEKKAWVEKRVAEMATDEKIGQLVCELNTTCPTSRTRCSGRWGPRSGWCPKGKAKGKIEIEYYSAEDFERIMERLKIKV